MSPGKSVDLPADLDYNQHDNGIYKDNLVLKTNDPLNDRYSNGTGIRR